MTVPGTTVPGRLENLMPTPFAELSTTLPPIQTSSLLCREGHHLLPFPSNHENPTTDSQETRMAKLNDTTGSMKSSTVYRSLEHTLF